MMTIWQTAEWIGLTPKILRNLAQLDDPFPMDEHWQSDPEAVRAWLVRWDLEIGSES